VETFYDCLGVDEDATTAEIEDAYREAVKQTHPDVSDDDDAGERTKRLNRARDVLTDDEERARYDRLGHAAYTGEETATGDGVSGTETTGASEKGRDGSGTDGAATRTARGADDRDRRRTAGANDETAGAGSAARSERTESQSARRQAAAGTTAGPNVDGSWNAWDSTHAWAVHRSSGNRPGFDFESLLPTEQSLLIVGSMLILYPLFVASALFPPFPLVARLVVAACILCLLVYMISLPEIGLFVFGIWGVIAAVGLVAVPGLSVLSLLGLAALAVTWIPFALAVLVLVVVEF